MNINDITHWIRFAGVGHIVTSNHGGWAYAACNSLIVGNVVTERPKRICSKCRANLGKLTPSKEPPR